MPLVNTRPRRNNAGRPAIKSALMFLQWLRGRPCWLADKGGCEGKIEAAHVDYAGGKGMATKVADKFAIPLCAKHHAEQHRGWKTFETKYAYIGAALAAAAEYWKAWPGRRTWEEKNNER